MDRDIKFFTGKKCRNGHLSERYISNNKCVACYSDYYQKNSEYIKKRINEFRIKNKSVCKKSWQNWYKKNAQKHKENNKKYYLKNFEKVKNYRKKHYKNNKDKYVNYERNRRAKINNASGIISAQDIKEILKSQKYRCAYCPANLRKIKYHIDHIIPIFSGGSNQRKNIQATCEKCNLRKNKKDPLIFARETGRLL